MVNSKWQNQKISRMDMNADPRVLAIPYVKISRASQYQANLFIGVQVFGIENLEL